MKLSEVSDEQQREGKIEYVDKRWKQLHELEIKRGDGALNYLFLVSGGSAAATLAYIGNVAKDGNPIPVGALWMLGCFAASLLLVGLINIRLVYHTVGIFRNWRNLVSAYYSDKIGWTEMHQKDEDVVKRHEWTIHFLGWSAYLSLFIGIAIGFVKLQEESSNVRPKEAIHANGSQNTGNQVTSDRDKGIGEREIQRSGETQSVGRSSSGGSAAAATAEEVKTAATNGKAER